MEGHWNLGVEHERRANDRFDVLGSTVTTMKKLILFLIASMCFAADVTLIHPDATTATYTHSNLQTAWDDSACGDIIEITPGADSTTTASQGLTLSGKGCTGWPGILIRTSKYYNLPTGQRINTTTDAANLAYVSSATSGYTEIIQTPTPTAVTIDPPAYIRFVGLKIQQRDQATNQIVQFGAVLSGSQASVRQEQLAHHIVFYQCWIHGSDSAFGATNGIQADTGDFEFRNGVIDNIKATGEVHGLISTSAVGPHRIINSQITALTINSLYGGANSNVIGRSPADILFLGNYYWKPFKYMIWSNTMDPTGACPSDSSTEGALYNATISATYYECRSGAWVQLADSTEYNGLALPRLGGATRGFNKNNFELKNATRVKVRGNVINGAWGLQFGSQSGAAVLYNAVDATGTSATKNLGVKVSHVDFRNNRIKNTASGIALGNLGWQINSITAGSPLKLNVVSTTGFSTEDTKYMVSYTSCITSVSTKLLRVINETQFEVYNTDGTPFDGSACTSQAVSSQTVIHGHYWESDRGAPIHDNKFYNNDWVFGDDPQTFPANADGNFNGGSFAIGLGGYANSNIVYAHNTTRQLLTRSSVLNRLVALDNPNYNVQIGLGAVKASKGNILADNIMTYTKNGWYSSAGSTNGPDGIQVTMGKHANLALNFHINNQSVSSTIYNANLAQHCTTGANDCPYTNGITGAPPVCRSCDVVADFTAMAFASYPTDLRLTSSSPAYRRATDGKDLGADINVVDWETEGVEAGTYNAYQYMGVRTIWPITSTTATFRFTALDTTSCAIDIRVFGFPDSSPLSGATNNFTTLERTSILIGLTADTHYSYKLTCGGTKYREGEFRTTP
jgi:hypothetical protein